MIVTRAFLENLLSPFSLPYPSSFLLQPTTLSPNDTLPSGVTEEEVAYIGTFVSCTGISMFSADLSPAWFEDDGMAHSFHSLRSTMPESGNGWVWMETVLIRLNNGFTPNATFPVLGADPIVNPSGISGYLGYDAVVCVELYEPWIVQIYNSSLGVPTTMSIVSKSASTDFETDGGNRGPRLDSYTRVLNSTNKDPAYYVRYAGSFPFGHC